MNKILIVILWLFILPSCHNSNQTDIDQTNTNNASLTILTALAKGDWDVVAAFVHPEKGLRFSPYAPINYQSDVVLSSDEITDTQARSKVRRWGNYHGTGEPIEMTLEDFCIHFIYSRDYANIEPRPINQWISVDVNPLGFRVDPNIQFIEYHFPGTSANENMDWSSLFLIFEQIDGSWYLISLLHNQWVI